MLQRIADEVRQDLFEQGRVAQHPLAIRAEAQIQTALHGDGQKILAEPIELRIDRHRLRLRLDDPRIEAGHIEKPHEQAFHGTDAVLDALDDGAAIRVDVQRAERGIAAKKKPGSACVRLHSGTLL